MTKKILKMSAVLIAFSFILAGLSQVSAAVVWSDNFDDGNYDGWTVEDGGYSVTDGALTSEATGDYYDIIWHPSTTAVGTWNFSFMYDVVNKLAVYIIMVMSVNQTISTNYQAGYGIKITDELGLDPTLTLIKQDGNYISIGNMVVPFVVADLQGTWTDFAVSRNSTGGLNVWINGTHMWEVVNVEHDTSEMFVYYTYTDLTGVEGGHLDNIVVDDEPISPYAQTTTPEPTDTTTPSETPTGPGEPTPIDPMLLAIAGVGVVIVIMAVVCMKRR